MWGGRSPSVGPRLAHRGVPALVLMGAFVVLVATALAVKERGTPGPDRLTGTAGADRLIGRGGKDRLSGRGGADLLKGGKGRDRLKGGKGQDRLLSGPGGGTMAGGPGSDEFNEIDGELVGGAGKDRIRARDGTEDAINCGPGKDVAVVDASEDGVFDCETIREPG
jgi:Ca2+-binding RTX toxin-like protein